MTREEAKEMIKHILKVTPKEPPTECDNVEEWRYEDDEIRKALDMAIKTLEQEPCVDAVSRGEVNMLCARYLKTATDDHVAFYEHFCDLPSVKPTRKEWIPVSERLPEGMGTYLVTLEYKEHGKGVTTLWYHGKEIGWDLCVADVVVAWMPLPEPYGEREGKNETN